jgi:hypothetical protein
MDPVVTVDDPRVAVEPGAQASVRVRIRNRSTIVEGFRLQVVGDAAEWATLYPAELEVRPQDEAEALVVFAPPSGSGSRAGRVPFGVRAVSQVDPGASAVAEGDLDVGSVALSQATVTPATSHGRFSARHRIEMANWGNAPVRLRLEVSDPDEALGFLLVPDTLDLPIGTTGRARLKVRARRPFFRGVPVRRPFRVVGRPLTSGDELEADGPRTPQGYDPGQPTVDGAYEQRPVLGRGLIPLALAAVVAVGVVGWLSTRPGDDPEAETAAPPPPEGFEVAALTPDTVRLSWQPGERVDTYTVLRIDPATADQPQPTATEVLEDIPAEQGRYDAAGLDPATGYCFQLAAVRNDVSSARTPVACTDTPQLAGAGAPLAPTGVTVEPGEPGKVRVSWQDASGGRADHVVLRDGTVVDVVTAPKAELIVDLASGENCFQVQAKQGDATSVPAPEPCIAAPAAVTDPAPGAPGAVPPPPPATSTTTTVLAELGPIAVVDAFPVDDTTAELRALSRRDELRAAGHQAEVLDSSNYPSLANASGNFYLVYVRGFATPADAQTFCDTNSFPDCLVYDL